MTHLNVNFENWMGNLPPEVSNLPITRIAIPGSHDTFTYSITRKSHVSPDAPTSISRLAHGGPLVKCILVNWARTQELNIFHQLNYGIRYLDIRLAANNGQYYIAHSLYGCEIFSELEHVLRYLNTHNKEVVILDFQHFYQFTNQDHFKLVSWLESIMGAKICPHKHSILDISLQGLWQEQKQVIIIYRARIMENHPLLWPSTLWPTPWPNQIKVDRLIDNLNWGLKSRHSDVGYVTQCVLTPTSKFISGHLFSSVKSLAQKNNSKLCRWLSTQSAGRHGINVAICDFISNSNFIQSVISLNYTNFSGEQNNPVY